MANPNANRKLNEILIKDSGFSRTEVIITEGESVIFVVATRRVNKSIPGNYDANNDNIDQDELIDPLETMSIVQVVNDDIEGKYRPVINGYESGLLNSKYVVKFKLIGEYMFKLQNHPKSPPLLRVKVIEEQPISLVITDDGFLPKTIRIDEGTSIKWSWNKLSLPHSIYEAEYCDTHGGLFRTSKELVRPTASNSYKRKFDEPGVYYFQTETRQTDEKHCCIVEVQQSTRFSPARLTIEEGDKVWFTWNKSKCQKKHCVYQIYPPAPDHPPDRAYIGVKSGFKWTSPTRNGMICFTFDKCGVYYYSDISGNEAASYIGIIAVKKKPEHHIVNFNEETQKFDQEILTVETGDLIWWKWNKSISLNMSLSEANLLYDKKFEMDLCQESGGCEKLETNSLTKSGVYSYQIKKAGCYYFLVIKETKKIVITVVATSAQKDHKINVTDNECSPNILNIHPEDRVWFMWDNTKRPQNIRQVNNQNQIIADGFLSGSLMESPGTFVESFNNLGIFYYRSDSSKGVLGAIVVIPEPTIQVIHVNEKGLNPDPIVINVNDVVIWEFAKPQSSDLVMIQSNEDIKSYNEKSRSLVHRRFLSKAFKDPGIYHFTSPSFDNTIDPKSANNLNGMNKTIISSVIVDKFEEHTTVMVNVNGFYPKLVNIQLGKSILFDWHDTDQAHNIIHVELPNEAVPTFKAVEGVHEFNSGQKVVNGSFLHSFDEEGTYCVISGGSENTCCIINVVKTSLKTPTPQLVKQEQYILYKYHKLFLECQAPNAIIHYTTDGLAPNNFSRVYSKEQGIEMTDEGINVIRAVAYSKDYLTSDIFTSSRFYVIPDPSEEDNIKYTETVDTKNAAEKNKEWWSCIPKISYTSRAIGCIELYWDLPDKSSQALVDYYQIFLNKVSYKNKIPSSSNRVFIKGLAGGRKYEVAVMVFPKNQTFLPQESNVLSIKCPRATNLGGPIISLKANPNRNQLTVCWLSIDSSKLPIEHYEIIVNGEKKEKVKPLSGKHKVTLDGCVENIKYSILLVAIPKNGTMPLISNELEVVLPLYLSEIKVPDSAHKNLDKDYYDEYIEYVDHEETKPDIQSDNNESNPKFAKYLSYDNYLAINLNNLLLRNSTNENIILDQNLTKSLMANVEKKSATGSASSLRKTPVSRNDSNDKPNMIYFKKLLNKLNIVSNAFEIPNNQSIATNKNKDIEQNNKIEENKVSEENLDLEKLPYPKLGVSQVSQGTISVDWRLSKPPPDNIKLTHFVLTLVGCEFGNSIKSDASYECQMESNGKQIPAVQHCWVTKNSANYSVENRFVVDGILGTAVYHITVHAIYKFDSSSTMEYKRSSKTIIYTPLGPPPPPKLKVSARDLYSANLEWIPQLYPRPEFITGYQLVVNGELNKMFEKDANEFFFSDMLPERKYDIEILTLTNSIVGKSAPSNRVTLICPMRPTPPLIQQLPSIRPHSATIGWKTTDSKTNEDWDNVICYKVFLNNKYHGEIYSSNTLSYSYVIDDLDINKSYNVKVQSYSGLKSTFPSEGPIVSCLASSEYSNSLMVSSTAPPDPPKLKLASLSPEGIEITWQFPQQYGDAVVSGFQLIKDGKCFGNLIPYDVNTYTVTGVEIGETVNLQMISLTNHPVAKYTALHDHPNYTMDQPQREDLINGSQQVKNKLKPNRLRGSVINSDYPACKPGPILCVQYTGIVKPATRVWSEKITGYSAIVFFQTIESPNTRYFKGKMNQHFVEPDYFLVSFWPGTTPEDNIQTIKTDKDFIQLNNLQPSTVYTVQVETRKESSRFFDYFEYDQSEKTQYTYIIYSKSSLAQFQTASPPDPPTNLSIVSTTCHAMKLNWDPPIDHGSDLIATRVDCFSLNPERPMHVIKELTADAKCCIIDNLSEKTNYKFIISAITEEYLMSHHIRDIKQLPKTLLESMAWLPSASIEGMTAGSDPAHSLEWKFKPDKSISVSWKLPKTYGTNRLINQILCYHEQSPTNPNIMAVQIPLPINASRYKIHNLKTGIRYKIWIEAVVLIKLNIEADTHSVVNFQLDNESIEKKDIFTSRIDHYKQLKDSRCTNVLSDPLLIRVPAPCESPILNLTGYSSDTIELYWAKPCLYSKHKDVTTGEEKVHMYRHLLGYRLEVNGIIQKSLQPSENICKLTECRPSKVYNIVIVALTCLSQTIESQNPLFKTEIDISEIDESHSLPLKLKTLSAENPHQINNIIAQYEDSPDTNEPSSIGRIRVDWSVNDPSHITQFNVNWYSVEELISKRKSFDSTMRSCYIPVTKQRCIYEINLETVYDNLESGITETLFIEVPGSPDAPILWLKDQKRDVVNIQWSEPRVFPYVSVAGYQIYLNDQKVGAKIDKDILKATLPLKPNRTYKINIQSLSSKPSFADSDLSNSISVTTSMQNNTNQALSNKETGSIKAPNSENEYSSLSQVLSLKTYYENENDRDLYGDATIPIRVKKLNENSIDFEWSRYIKQEGVNEFRVNWHCLETNEHFEYRCLKNVLSYRINKLKPGFHYCLKISAIKLNTTVVTRSKNYVFQTCAPPDTPVIKLRACNFKYITVEWNKPMTYGEADIVNYRLFIDGKLEAVLSSEQTIFTLSKGEPCHEYSFQVQAVTSDENLPSVVSKPLNVTWPGVKVPVLKQIENENGILRFAWDEPSITGNAKLSFYRLIAINEKSGKTLVQGPIDLNIHECEFESLEHGFYKVHLEVNAYGLSEPFCSNSINVDFGHAPEAPLLNVEIPGLEQRRKLDKIASNLVNKRDKLLNLIHNNPYDGKQIVLPKAMTTLRHLEDGLNDCLKLIGNYTGYFVINLSWTMQNSQIVKVLGFRVYVNGKQYGLDLQESVRAIRVKLSLERPVHSIYITAFTDRAKLESQSSNVIELLSENFFPFTYYCYHEVHSKNISWPEKGCCAYQDTLPVERSNLNKAREIINLGLLSEPIQALRCEVTDLATNRSKNLVESRGKTSTVILFWTKWCLASIRTLNYLVMYAKRFPNQNEYVACHVGPDSQAEMIDLLKKCGYFNTNVKFVCDVQYAGKPGGNHDKSSIDSFDIKGVPTIAIVNKNGYIVWKGRYCAYEFSHFESFMNHTITSEVNNLNCPIKNCEICVADTSIEKDLNDLRTEQKYFSHYMDSLKRPLTETWTAVGSQRRRSVPKLPKLSSISTRQLFAVNVRKRSGSERSLTHSNSIQIARSYSRNKIRPSSTDSHGFCYYSK